MYRDDAYIARMMHIVSRVYGSFVQPPPPPLSAASRCTGPLPKLAVFAQQLPVAAAEDSGRQGGLPSEAVPAHRIREPPVNMYFKHDTEYREFLVYTARLARSARLVVEGGS